MQSLRLVRSILMLIALLSVIVLWSEIHSAFGFLENITLWDVTSTVQGVESLEPITLGAVLIAILVLIITMQLVRNLPALLELALLQHLDLAPGTGYAITTVTKYLLLLVGTLVGFSMIGIEWSKLQWLVAAPAAAHARAHRRRDHKGGRGAARHRAVQRCARLRAPGRLGHQGCWR